MTFFELFDIPIQLKVDKAGLHQKFIALSRQYHPDYFVKDGQKKLAEVQDISASLNKAYKTFQDPDATIRYVLDLKELIEEEEKYKLPPDFLMEVMEINEQLMDLEQSAVSSPQSAAGSQSAIQQLSSNIHNLHTEIYEPVKSIIENYQEGVTTKEELLRVKEYYYKKKYLDRIRRELAGKM